MGEATQIVGHNVSTPCHGRQSNRPAHRREHSRNTESVNTPRRRDPEGRNARFENARVVRADKESVLFEVPLERVRTEYLEDAHQLIVVVPPAEEVLSMEDLQNVCASDTSKER